MSLLSLNDFSDAHHVYQAINNYHKINCTSLYIQCGVLEDKSNVLLDLVLQIMKEPFFNVLRTQVKIFFEISHRFDHKFQVKSLKQHPHVKLPIKCVKCISGAARIRRRLSGEKSQRSTGNQICR